MLRVLFPLLTEEKKASTFPAMASRPPLEPFPVSTPAATLVFTTVLTQGPVSRVEVGRRTGLSSAAITKAVRPLLDAGYLVEAAEGAKGAALGRPANPLRVDGGRAFFIGIKVTGDEAIGVLADLTARIRAARHVSLDTREPAAVLEVISALTAELRTAAEDYGVPVQSVGVAVSGDVDREVGMVHYSPFLGWRDVPLAELVRGATGLPTVVDNDVRALTVAEQWFGAGVGADTFALVTVGAGIGCGLVVGGRVVAGAHGVAGEIGHLPIEPAGPPCHCGNSGCVEAIAADPAIVRRIREVTGEPVATAEDALALARSGHPGAREAYARAGYAIGTGIAAVVNLLGPGRVVISGEGLTAYDLFEEQIRAAFATAAFGAAKECELLTRPLPFEEWARGAAATAIQMFIGPDKP
jgi:predicted NBD/HSP70 family sugar kinase/biotin operon repressor